MTFEEIQKRIDDWISQFEEGYFPPLVQLSRMMEELGELSRSVSHELGVKKPKPGEQLHSVEEEFGDLLFVLLCFANERKICVSDVLERTLEKIDKRDTSRWTLKKEDACPAKR